MSTFYRKICGNLSYEWFREWNSSSPDIPECFQYFDYPLYLLIYAVLCIPYILWLNNQTSPRRLLNKLCFFKILAVICLMVLQGCELLFFVMTPLNVRPASYFSNVFIFSSLVIILAVIIFEKRCNAMNSGFYFNYWILFLCLCCVKSRTARLNIRYKSQRYYVASSIFIFLNLFLVIVSFILSCFSDKIMEQKTRRWTYHKRLSNVLKINAEANGIEEHVEMSVKQESTNLGIWSGKDQIELEECPESYASFLSRISFFWFTPLIVRGYKRPLTNNDMWLLNEGDYCRNVVPTMMDHLQRYLVVNNDDPTTKNDDHSNTNANSVLVQEKDQPIPPAIDETKKKLLEGGEKANVKDKFDPSLMYALLQTNWFELLLTGFYKLFHDTLIFLGPLLLKLLIDFVLNSSDHIWKGYLFAALIFITAVIRSFILHQYFHIVFRMGMRIRSSVVSIVYRKALVLSTASRKESTVGEIVNLMSVDAQKFLELTSYIHMIWSGPFQIIIAMILLWRELGPSVLAGIAVMLLLIPINGVIGNMTRKLQAQQLKVSDQRIKLMNEILNGIKVLKLYAWETSFIKFITGIRNKELSFMRRSAYLSAAISFTFNCAPFIVSLTSFGMFVLVSDSNILTAEKAFVSLSLFNILRFPLLMLPMVISNLIQASVSLKRLTKFLKQAEIDQNAVQHVVTEGEAASIKNGHFSWDHSSKNPFLHNINIVVPEGELIAIVGPVGSGKSSILSALLGEINKVEGSVNVIDSVAYVPQQAWIINATVRENILFGNEFDSCRYQRVLTACCLTRDLEILKNSDLTEIGEKGINLSGGQKQRISLARACYSNAKLLLLDDPLSAVDSHVGKDLIDNVLGPNGILSDRTRVLVTHNLAVLPFCHQVIVLENGEITEEGSYKELIKHAGAFSKFVATHLSEEIRHVNGHKMSSEELFDADQILKDIQLTLTESNESNSAIFSTLSKSREKLRLSLMSLNDERAKNVKEKDDEGDGVVIERKCEEELRKIGIDKVGGTNAKLIEEETSKVGNVNLSVYVAYFRSVGIWISLIILFLFIITQAFSLGSNLWLVRWSRQSNEASNYTSRLQELKGESVINKSEVSKIKTYLNYQRDLNLGVYGLFGLGQALMSLVASVIFAYGTVRAANHLHQLLLNGVIRYPAITFEVIPLGRIINRFSSDVNSVGSTLPQSINILLILVISSLATFIMISLPNLWIIPPLTFIFLFYVIMQRIYVATSRQLKRLESVSKSPIYSHFGETLQGVSSIRAYNLCDQFINTSEEKVDVNLYAYYANISSNRWLAIILEFIGNLVVFLAAMFSVISVHLKLNIDAGLVGLSVSYALSITQTLNWLVRMSSDVESNIVSVERIDEYSHMEPEALWEIPEKKPGDDWPSGKIEFKNYSTRYREGLDLVLDGISFMVQSGEKVGIVGRTGSGKSSLVLALFRILERSDGEILIDDVPIQGLGLHDIRGRLTIIPQDPVLFSGTLRRNLDPFNKHSDDEIWKVLELSNLKTFVSNSGEDKLEMTISEGGDNLSVGQRQLVCLARALLRRTKILVLDEATAAVDLDTDDLIQNTIRSEFRNCTILTIAHRLNTVLDYDKIMVLDHGHIVEMDSPSVLLKNTESHFYAMAKSANLV